MARSRKRRHLTVWIAVLSVLLACLAPSISHGLAAFKRADVPNKIEIVSVEFAKETTESASHTHGLHELHDPQPAGGHDFHFEHCPFCFTHAGSFATPPPNVIAVPVVIGSPVSPILFFHSPRPLFTWAAAQARAPPVNS